MNLLRTLATLALVSFVKGAPTPPEGFDHHANIAADSYDLYWTVKDKEIHFEVQVKTLGFVGFGISKTGGMVGADIVTAWVKDDRVFFQDRYSGRNGEPPIDDEQNWVLISGREQDGYTIVQFKRPLISCDKENDIDITGETMRLIYAFHPDDPQDASSIKYHGSNRRGTKSVTLILHGSQKDKMPEYSGYVDFLNPNVTIPADDTTYWCQAFKMPNLSKKHQVVRIEPIIQSGHEGLVHHILLYACYHEFDEDLYEGLGAACYEDLMGEVNQCTAVIAGWAIGGKAINFPEHAGYPIGKGHPPTMIMMQTHYDNPPPSKSGIVDGSGLRLYYTDKIREYDAGVLEFGAFSDESLVVPPKFDSLITETHCTAKCLSAAIPEDEDLKVFGVFLHAHLLGAKMKVRHFRDGKELAPIAKDDYYDFNYQDYRMLPKEIIIKPNDHLITECDYNSAHRTNTTYGGIRTKNEMCLAYILHYPKRTFSRCLSGPMPYNIVKFIDPTIEVTSLEQVMDNVNWDDPKWRQRFQENMLKTGVEQYQICNDGYSYDLLESDSPFFEVPKFDTKYESPPVECYNYESSGHLITGSIILLILTTLSI